MTFHELTSKPVAEWTQADIDARIETLTKELDETISSNSPDDLYARGLKSGYASGYRQVLELMNDKAKWNSQQ